jgi:hypothetical protein
MTMSGKNILRAIIALSVLASINVYSAYNPCIERPQYLRPKFSPPQFIKPDFEKTKFEKTVIEKPIIAVDDFLKPNFVRPSFVLPKYQDCAAMKEKKTPLEKALRDHQQKQMAGLVDQTRNNDVNTSQTVNKTTEQNANSHFFYKPTPVKSENKEEDCCGAVVTEKQVKSDASLQVVTSHKQSELR